MEEFAKKEYSEVLKVSDGLAIPFVSSEYAAVIGCDPEAKRVFDRLKL